MVIQVAVKFKRSTVDNHQEDDLINMTHTQISAKTNLASQATKQASSWSPDEC
jgi:hypothetical protein